MAPVQVKTKSVVKLGFSTIRPHSGKAKGLCLAKEVNKEGPAAKSGLLAGDEICTINKVPTADLTEKKMLELLSLGHGESAELGLRRNGQMLNLQLAVP